MNCCICHDGAGFPPEFSPSVLPFSHMNEDYQPELEVIYKIARERGASNNLNVLCIASSGETALSILSAKEVAQVDAVDLHPWQAHSM